LEEEEGLDSSAAAVVAAAEKVLASLHCAETKKVIGEDEAGCYGFQHLRYIWILLHFHILQKHWHGHFRRLFHFEGLLMARCFHTFAYFAVVEKKQKQQPTTMMMMKTKKFLVL